MEDLIQLIVALGISGVFLFVGLLVGRSREKAHLRSIARRLEESRDVCVTSLRTLPASGVMTAPPPQLVTGEAVIASDAFKTWISSFRNLFGGEMHQYTRLYQRARDEALLRVIEQARVQGFNALFNVRYDTADIMGNTAAANGGKRQSPMAVCSISATACRIER